jgi:hypothetical protein
MKKRAVVNTVDDETRATKPVILSEQDLLDRWRSFLPYKDAKEKAYKKFLYRLRNLKGKKHLKALPVGKNFGFRLADVEEWENINAKNSMFPAFAFSDDPNLAVETAPKGREHTADEKASAAKLIKWLGEIKDMP